jgi:signal transduction histidine kinase
MRNLNQRIKKRYYILAVGVLIGFILTDSLLIKLEYQNYMDKIHIISSMIGDRKSNKDNTAIASDLLKNKNPDNKYGIEVLKEYGYLSDYDNSYKSLYKRNVLLILALSLLLYFIIIMAVINLYKLFSKDRSIDFKRLERVLIDFKNGTYSANNIDINTSDTELGSVYSKLAVLGDYLQVTSERMQQEKEETKSLVTDISHQLKTPVAALRTCFEILQQKNLSPEEIKEFTDRYNQQMEGLENLLDALINISRMEIGMIQIKREEGSIYETLIAAVNRVYMKAENKMVDIGMEADEKLQRLCLKHDRKWLCEAFINILDNAIKYSYPNTQITIRMLERTSFLRIEIEDQGIGIPKEEYNSIFKRFYRGNSEAVKNQSGTGVGLYLSREIINRHSGTISVASEGKLLNTGSIFTVQLPYKS